MKKFLYLILAITLACFIAACGHQPETFAPSCEESPSDESTFSGADDPSKATSLSGTDDPSEATSLSDADESDPASSSADEPQENNEDAPGGDSDNPNRENRSARAPEKYLYSTNTEPNLFPAAKGFFPVDPGEYYVIYSSEKVTVRKFDGAKKLLSEETFFPSSGKYYLFHCAGIEVIGGPDTVLATSGLRDNGIAANLTFYAIGEENPLGVSVNRAVQELKSGGTVLILPGTYEEEVKGWKKTVNLWGLEKNRTIVQNGTGDYDHPPIEIGAGSLRNLTVRAYGDVTNEFGAYAVHVEDDALFGKELLIENCDLCSSGNHSLGIGLRRGTVTIRNCTMERLFCHDSEKKNLGGTQILNLENNTIEQCYFMGFGYPEANFQINADGCSIQKIETLGNGYLLTVDGVSTLILWKSTDPEPIGPEEPTEPEPSEPSEPTESSEPGEPSETIGPEPTEPTEPSAAEPSDPTAPSAAEPSGPESGVPNEKQIARNPGNLFFDL